MHLQRVTVKCARMPERTSILPDGGISYKSHSFSLSKSMLKTSGTLGEIRGRSETLRFPWDCRRFYALAFVRSPRSAKTTSQTRDLAEKTRTASSTIFTSPSCDWTATAIKSCTWPSGKWNWKLAWYTIKRRRIHIHWSTICEIGEGGI